MKRTRWETVLFLLPTLAVILFIFGYPLLRIFDFSFRRIQGASGPFIGLENYRLVLSNPVFLEAVVHNLFLLLGVPIMIAIALLIAVLLFEEPFGWRVHRLCIFIPYIIAIPVIGIVFSYMLSLHGVVNQVLEKVGLHFLALDWIGNPRLTLATILLVIVWKEAGFGVVLFLARLMSLSPELYDSARIDGTSWIQTLWYITVPQLRMVIEFFGIVSIITFLAWVFGYVYVITGGGPGNATQVMELWIFNRIARGSPNPGMASAASVLLLVFSSVFIFMLLNLRLKGGEE